MCVHVGYNLLLLEFIHKYLCTGIKDAHMKAKFTDESHVL